ncbi:MAG: DUF2690 domain-containing protein [Chloroflexota bacterium]
MHFHFSLKHVRFSRLFASVVVALLVSVCLFMLTPFNAAAGGPGCYGAGCRNKDPQAMGCHADAVTLAIIPHPGTASAGYQQFTELRYSKACNARWSRVVSRLTPSDIYYTGAWVAGHWITTHRTIFGAGGGLVWSRMWSGSVSACGVSVSNTDPTYKVIGCAP